MHALVGGAVTSATGGDFKTGAIAAGASQALAGVLNSTFDTQPELREAFSQLVGLTAAGLAGGDVEKASWVALMADQYNRQLHQKETVALERLQKETPEKAYELKAAACALVHCSASVPTDDPAYDAVQALEADGKGFKDAQNALIATGAFDEYSKWDQANDDLLVNDKELRQSSQASRAVLGAIGAAAGFGGAMLSTPACITGAGCAIPAFSGAAGAASFLDGWQATGQLFAPYQFTQGNKVLSSFSSATYPGDVNPLRDYGTEAAKAALEIALLKGAGKYLDGAGASVLVSGGPKATGVADETAGSIRNVNPGYPDAGRTHNCVNCSIATDATLVGNPASALPINSTKGVPLTVLEKQYGAKFSDVSSTETITQHMVGGGDGARGIVFGSYGPGQPGHVFNVVNQNGVIRYLDGRTGKPANMNNFKTLQLLRTN